MDICKLLSISRLYLQYFAPSRNSSFYGSGPSARKRRMTGESTIKEAMQVISEALLLVFMR